MRLLELLPIIDDIDGTPMRTTYKIVFTNNNNNQMGNIQGIINAKIGNKQ